MDQNVSVSIGDNERRGGLYVLGKPRTGKSNLLVSLALDDIGNGHGMLFIDPHSHAINDLYARFPDKRPKDVSFFDPTLKTRSFSINYCIVTIPLSPRSFSRMLGV